MELTSRQIIDNNRVIAKFMGVDVPVKTFTFAGRHMTIYHKVEDVYNWDKAILSYHSSWDKLIPSIQKADAIHRTSGMEGILVHGSVKQYIDTIGLVKRKLIKMDIEECFLAMANFVRWYEATKKNNDTVNRIIKEKAND